MFSFLWRLIARTDIKTCFQHTTQAQHSELFQMTKKFKWGCGKTGKGKHARLDFSQKQIQASRWRGPPTVGWRGAAGKTFLLPLSLFVTIVLSFIDINYQIFPPLQSKYHPPITSWIDFLTTSIQKIIKFFTSPIKKLTPHSPPGSIFSPHQFKK